MKAGSYAGANNLEMTDTTENRKADAVREKALDLRNQVDGWVKRASEASGVGEKALKAGLLFSAGLVLGLLLRRRTDR
jgi:hypothetical protein